MAVGAPGRCGVSTPHPLFVMCKPLSLVSLLGVGGDSTLLELFPKEDEGNPKARSLSPT